GASEIPSGRIGEMVLERLAERDPLSYLRFKIVYSRLEDLDALYDELASLVRIRQVARDRRVAEQITLPIAEPVIAGPSRRRRRYGSSAPSGRVVSGRHAHRQRAPGRRDDEHGHRRARRPAASVREGWRAHW